MKELVDTIKSLKNKKAAGLDKITAEFLKASPERILKILLQLLNTIFTTKTVPRDWCVGIINPIHKEGCKEDPDNYRGICISSRGGHGISVEHHAAVTRWWWWCKPGGLHLSLLVITVDFFDFLNSFKYSYHFW